MTDTQSRHEFTQIGKPPEEAHTPEQLAEEWAEREGGYKPSDGSGFFVRTKAFLAGHRSRDPEVAQLREEIEAMSAAQDAVIHRAQELEVELVRENADLTARVAQLENALELTKPAIEALNTTKARVSSLTAALREAHSKLKILKVAVNDKQPDPGATSFVAHMMENLEEALAQKEKADE